MPLIPDPRSKLARNFKEGLDLTDIMPGGMGMAAKMSSPAVDVLERWIRRFRKDKPPTVPLKNIEKALKNEYERRTKKILVKRPMDDPLYSAMVEPPFSESLRYVRGRSIEPRSYMGPENLPVPGQPAIHRPLGAKEKDPFGELWDFIETIRKPKIEDDLEGHPVIRRARDVYAEELARNWKKK